MNQSDDETRKKVKQFEESLLESERNPNAKENLEQLIERAAQPLPKGGDTPRPDERYTETQTHSRSTEDTSEKHSDTSHP